MSSAFESIMRGLEDVKAHRDGTKKLTTRTVTVKPLDTFTSEKVKEIRNSLQLSQRVFAESLGVSIKSVEAWESGKNSPSGAARRLLEILERDSDFLKKEKILIES